MLRLAGLPVRLWLAEGCPELFALVLPDGRPVAVTGSEDARVRIWDLTTGTPVGDPLTGHTRAVGAVATVVPRRAPRRRHRQQR